MEKINYDKIKELISLTINKISNSKDIELKTLFSDLLDFIISLQNQIVFYQNELSKYCIVLNEQKINDDIAIVKDEKTDTFINPAN
jgi:hypothetical protein